jgi:HEAT repeat protein
MRGNEKTAVAEIARRGRGKFYDARTSRELAPALKLTVRARPAPEPGPRAAPDPKPAPAPAAASTATAPHRVGPSDAVVRLLIEQLSDEDGRIRQDAANSLAGLGEKARPAVPALVERVADALWENPGYENNLSKDAALAALKKLGPDRFEEALLAAAKSQNPNIKNWAIRRLHSAPELVGAATIKALGAFLGDPNWGARHDAAWGLGQLGSRAEPAVSQLEELIAGDLWEKPGYENDLAKDAALDALKKLAPDRVEAALLRAARSSQADVKGWAVRRLGRLSNE